MKSYFVYIVRCSDKSYYTGSTYNLEKRIKEHNFGKYSGYTKSRLPVKLVFSTEFHNPIEAVSAERKIKGWSRKKKEALIVGNFDLMHQAAECKNETHYKNRIV